MNILAIDPGPKESGWVLFDGDRVLGCGVRFNDGMLEAVQESAADVLAIEKIEAMGMAVGADVFETVHWSGRFHQAWREPGKVQRVTRRAVKLHLCGNMRAKDPNIRQALIDMLGAPGTKKAPGPTHGVSSHAWSALAVAVVARSVLVPTLNMPAVRQLGQQQPDLLPVEPAQRRAAQADGWPAALNDYPG